MSEESLLVTNADMIDFKGTESSSKYFTANLKRKIECLICLWLIWAQAVRFCIRESKAAGDMFWFWSTLNTLWNTQAMKLVSHNFEAVQIQTPTGGQTERKRRSRWQEAPPESVAAQPQGRHPRSMLCHDLFMFFDWLVGRSSRGAPQYLKSLIFTS